jgi:iron complex transport system substrate-binding protein
VKRKAHLSLRVLASVVALVLLLAAACGDDGGGDGGDSAGDSESQSESGTVTVEHQYGTTEVPTRPQRIVSLDTQWTDVLLALDATPVGYLSDASVEGGILPWQGDRLADATAVEATDALPYEEIAGLRPDLIVVTYLAQDEGDYETLSDIAPTIPLLSGNQVDSWQDMASVAGSFLGAAAAPEALVDEIDGEVNALADELPGLEGKTFALANFVPGDAIYVVADPEDGANRLFAQLGLEITPTILDVADDVSGRVELSLEQSSLLDGDLLVLFTNGAEARDMAGYEQLPAVRSGAVAVLDYAAVVGLNTPSPLSVPYSLERIRPALEAAAA